MSAVYVVMGVSLLVNSIFIVVVDALRDSLGESQRDQVRWERRFRDVDAERARYFDALLTVAEKKAPKPKPKAKRRRP
jgi:hypothetical protein